MDCIKKRSIARKGRKAASAVVPLLYSPCEITVKSDSGRSRILKGALLPKRTLLQLIRGLEASANGVKGKAACLLFALKGAVADLA